MTRERKMKRRWMLVLLGLLWGGAVQAGVVPYQVDGQAFEGYYLAAPDKQAPLVCWYMTGTG